MPGADTGGSTWTDLGTGAPEMGASGAAIHRDQRQVEGLLAYDARPAGKPLPAENPRRLMGRGKRPILELVALHHHYERGVP